MRQAPVDIDDQVAVLLVKLLTDEKKD